MALRERGKQSSGLRFALSAITPDKRSKPAHGGLGQRATRALGDIPDGPFKLTA